ncbi:MAG: T9SS type A sorting domain-containing protein [Bacteroidales bacterium]|nr:T9SS type A sorting domain-containing protein [Bacteroidales bacterium]
MKLLVFTLALLISTSVLAQIDTLNFGLKSIRKSQSPQRVINDRGISGVDVNYTIDFAKILPQTEIDSKGKTRDFKHLNVEGFSFLQVPGQAALPAKIDMIIVPQGADYQLEVINYTRRLHQGFHLFPARKPARDTEGAPEPEFEYDEVYYSQNSFFPATPVQIVETIEIRGMTILMVQYTPVQYNPAKKEIYTISDIKYRISFSKAKKFTEYHQHSQTFLNSLSAFPLNGQSLLNESNQQKSTSKSSSLATPNYLIITQESLLQAADSLATWKTQMGYNVEIISSLGWTASNVKDAIQTRYQNYFPKPDYFVILGDVQHVPAELYLAPDGSGNYGTDLYYACMGGGSDYVPEMAHGRISVANATQGLSVVQKIINYERNPVDDTSFYQNGLNCAQFQDDDNNGYADRRFTHTSEDVRNYVMSQGYSVERVYYTDNNVIPYKYNASYYSVGQDVPAELLKTNGYPWSGGATGIKNAINAGKFYLLHRDHGYAGGTGWAHPYYTSTAIGQLTNGNKLPVVFSINCHTGEFTLSNCFAETFLRHSNGGAVGIFAAAYYSYSGYNDGLTGGLFDAIWSNPGLIPAFGSGGIASPTVQSHPDIINMGFVLNHGLLRMSQTWGGDLEGRKYSYRLFHYFGDPAMIMWTAKPDSITATHLSNINCNDTSFYVSNISDSVVTATLSYNDELLGTAVISNGAGYIPLQYVFGQTVKLTLTSRNKIPYIANITVNPGGQLNLSKYVKNNRCYGDSIGIITINPSCGNPPYQVQWADGSTSLSRNNLPGGNYIVTITDTVNNILTDTITVWSPSQPLNSVPSITDALCYFESSGEITLNIAGGASPYQYQWSTGHSGATAGNLAAGNVSVTVTDSVGCTYVQSFTIDQPAPLDVNTTFADDTANACVGSGTAIVTGGTPPYTYLWNDPSAQTTPTASGLCQGLYKVIVKDSNLCMQYRTIILGNTMSISELDEENEVILFPNPADEWVYLTTGDLFKSGFRLTIFNANGQIVFSESMNVSLENETKVNVGSMASGNYLLRIENNSGIVRHVKLVIKRN